MSVNFRCARPGCGLVTHFYDPSKKATINIQGQAAHIHPASRRGPRSDDSDVILTDEQVRSFENGIWLCANCATLIDRLPNEYPGSLLRLWHDDAVERIRRTGLAGGRNPVSDTRMDAQAVSMFLEPVRVHILNGWTNRGQITLDACRALQTVMISGVHKGPGNTKLALQHSVRNRQLAMCELAKTTFLAIEGTSKRFRPITYDTSQYIIGYEIGSHTSNDKHEHQQWLHEDQHRHSEFLRLYRELDLYLTGGPMALSDVDW